MPNKREFKKYVEALGASVCDEMMVAYYNIEGVDRDKIRESIGRVLGAVGVATSHANIFFDRGVKAFPSAAEYSKEKSKFFRALFRKIATDFSAEIDAALKEFNAAIPAEVRERQRQEVAR